MNGERVNLRHEPSEERNWSTANESDFPMTGVEKGMSSVRLQAKGAARAGRAQHLARTSRALHCRSCVLGPWLRRTSLHTRLGAQPAWNCRHRPAHPSPAPSADRSSPPAIGRQHPPSFCHFVNMTLNIRKDLRLVLLCIHNQLLYDWFLK